jgi:hypothetical protein
MKTAENSLRWRMLMQFALLIYHSTEEFALRKQKSSHIVKKARERGLQGTELRQHRIDRGISNG